jgi:hypothetical protein
MRFSVSIPDDFFDPIRRRNQGLADIATLAAQSIYSGASH